MPGAEWLELLCKHIPDRYEHLVRYVGWYSNRARGERAKALKDQDTTTTPAVPSEPRSESVARAKAAWARGKVYEVDLLACPRPLYGGKCLTLHWHRRILGKPM